MGFKKHRVVPFASFGTLTRRLADDEKKHVGSGGKFGLCRQAGGNTVRLTADGRILMRNTL